MDTYLRTFFPFSFPDTAWVIVTLVCLSGETEGSLRHVAYELIHIECFVKYLCTTTVFDTCYIANLVVCVSTLTAECRSRACSGPTTKAVVECRVLNERSQLIAWLHVSCDVVDNHIAHLSWDRVDHDFIGCTFVVCFHELHFVPLAEDFAQLFEAGSIELFSLCLYLSHIAFHTYVVFD